MTEPSPRGPYPPPGPEPLPDGRCAFEVWAPRADRVEVVLLEGPGAKAEAGAGSAPHRRIGDGAFTELRAVPLDAAGRGYHRGVAGGVGPGALYHYRLDGETDVPDPASRHQPFGVHGPSRVVERALAPRGAEDAGPAPRPLPPSLPDYVIYELHVGTFTEAGTFDAAVEHLPYLAELGVTAVELMPVSQFPGTRNWGYDGVQLYAVQHSYGGPSGLRRFVEACHAHGLAVILDVVYNHLGPEGNDLGELGPYFTDVYETPWGDAFNFDGPGSDEVRRFVIANALYWIDSFDIDALRLDAVHAILDRSACHILEELATAVHARSDALGRSVHVIAESDLNDSRLIRRRTEGGYGLDGQWSDDFHHALHALLTDERRGYYGDFGSVEALETAYRQGWVYAGQYSAFRRRRHGDSPAGIPAFRFVACTQNHDQVGNRPRGDRSGTLLDHEARKLAAGALLLAPFTPLLFMGQEYGETAPFPYFVSHADEALARAVRRGREAELAAFGWEDAAPDPRSADTFRSAILDHSLRRNGSHATLLELYRALLRLRCALLGRGAPVRDAPARDPARPWRSAADGEPGDAHRWPLVARDGDLITLSYAAPADVMVALSFGTEPADARLPSGPWVKRLDSAAARWDGPGATAPAAVGAVPSSVSLPGRSFCVYTREETP